MSTAPSLSRSLPPSNRPAAMSPAALSANAPSIDPVRLLRTYYPWIIASVIAGVVLGVGSYFGLRILTPRYTAIADFQMLPATNDPSAPVNASQSESGGDELERYMQTQALVLRSARILTRTLQEREVQDRTKWAKKYFRNGSFDTIEAQKDLRDIISARPIPQTSWVRLSVTVRSPEDAQKIAKTISDVYLQENNQLSNRDTLKLIEQFSARIRTLKSETEALDVQMDSLVTKEELPAVNQRDTALFIEASGVQAALIDVRQELTRAKDQLKQYESQLNAPGGTVYPEAVRAAAEKSPVVAQMDLQIALATASLRGLREEFGDSHPSVARSRNSLNAMEEERRRRLEREMADTFRTAVEALSNGVSNLEASEKDLLDRGDVLKRKLTEVTNVLKQYEDLHTDREAKTEQVSRLEEDVQKLQLIRDRGARVMLGGQIELPDTPSFPPMVPTIALGIILVIGATCGAIVLKELREQRIRSPQDVAIIPRTRVMGVIPDVVLDPTNPTRVETASLDRPDGAVAESIRQIRMAMLKFCHEKQLKTVLVASGMPGSGSTSVICNLAINMAAIDLNVLVIDGNVRRPAVHGIFGLSIGPGFSEVLVGSANLESAVQSTSIPGLSVLTAGHDRARAYERFTTQSVADLMTKAKEKYDIVLVDCPPAVVSGDALALAGKCDGVMLVVRAFHEKRGLVARLRNQLDDTRAEFVGLVVNAVRPSAGGYFKRNIEAATRYSLNGDATVTPEDNKPAKDDNEA